MELTDNVFIVTGASSGIGAATARLAHERGARVLAAARKPAAGPHDDRFVGVRADVTNEPDRRRIVEEAMSAFGHIDVLVNAAGIIGNGSIENTTLEEWDVMMDVNLRSMFRLTQLALPEILKRKGNIVNVSSVTGLRAFPNVLAYCVSKAGVDQLTRCAALELAPKGVRVNAVDPGVVVTNLHKVGGMNDEKYAAFLEHSTTTHPLGRVGRQEEVAELILFLASGRAGWVTGTTVSIDGGR